MSIFVPHISLSDDDDNAYYSQENPLYNDNEDVFGRNFEEEANFDFDPFVNVVNDEENNNPIE